MNWQSLGAQLLADEGGSYDSYRPRGKNTRQFYSGKRPVSLKSHIADNFSQALAEDTYRYREGAEVYLISPEKVKDVDNTYQLKTQSELKRGHTILKGSRSGDRLETSEVATSPEVNLDLSAKKIARINSQSRQFHHMMDLDSYAPFFRGLDENGVLEMTGQLNQRGFYPGDDRRNYVGLSGNVWAKPGRGNVVKKIKNSEHQGKMHPMLIENRKAYPMPTADEIAVLSPAQRVEVMLPHLVRDRATLQQVLNTRRPGISERVSAAPRVTTDDLLKMDAIMQLVS